MPSSRGRRSSFVFATVIVMAKSLRVSNGQLPLYGSQPSSSHIDQSIWRHRICNERVGAPTSDRSGANTAVGMLWYSGSLQDRDRHQLTSRKRVSELKMMQDFGVRTSQLKTVAGRVPPMTAAAFKGQTTTSLNGVPFMPHSARSEGSKISSAAPKRNFLAEAAEARDLGQTYLKMGNLQQARRHLTHSEKLFKMYDGEQLK